VVSNTRYGTAHNGLSDWYLQRVSAVALAVLMPLPVLLLLGVYTNQLNQLDLLNLLDQFASRLLHTILILALLAHAYTGLKVIFEDYVHPIGLRVPLVGAMLVTMIGIGVWWLAIIWAWGA